MNKENTLDGKGTERQIQRQKRAKEVQGEETGIKEYKWWEDYTTPSPPTSLLFCNRKRAKRQS